MNTQEQIIFNTANRLLAGTKTAAICIELADGKSAYLGDDAGVMHMLQNKDQSGAVASEKPQFPWNPDPINHEWTQPEIAAIHAFGEGCFQAGVSSVQSRAAVRGEAVALTDVDRLRMPKRDAFIEWAKDRAFDVTESKDAWGNREFVHPHIESIWFGWFHAPSEPACKLCNDTGDMSLGPTDNFGQCSCRAADALDNQPSPVQPDYDALRRTIHELRTYSPAGDAYHGAHIHKVWADAIEAAICEPALVDAITRLDSQPTELPAEKRVVSVWDDLAFREAVLRVNEAVRADEDDPIEKHAEEVIEATRALAVYVDNQIDNATDSSQPTDATRYQRLRVLGAAPCGSKQLDAGNVLRFQGLDAFIDADLAAHPSRGEASSQPTVRSSAPDGWISVKDGLPELGQTVLAVNSEYGQRESKFDRWPKGSINRSNYGEEAGYFKWQEPMNNWGSSWEPTHWRQLLTAPASSQPTDGGVRNG